MGRMDLPPARFGAAEFGVSRIPYGERIEHNVWWACGVSLILCHRGNIEKLSEAPNILPHPLLPQRQQQPGQPPLPSA